MRFERDIVDYPGAHYSTAPDEITDDSRWLIKWPDRPRGLVDNPIIGVTSG
jgi:hypothetical protein